MIGAVYATGCENAAAPELEPTKTSTAVNDRTPTLRPQNTTWSAHGHTRGRSAVARRIAPNSVFVITPMKKVWSSEWMSPGGTLLKSPFAATTCWTSATTSRTPITK